MTELRATEFAQEVFLFPDIAGRLDPPPVIHVEGGLISIGRPRIAGEPNGVRTCGRNEFAVAEDETDFGYLRRAGPRQMEEALAAQTGQRLILNAMSVEPGKCDIRDIIKTQNQPAIVPGAAALACSLVHPLLADAPMGEPLIGRDGGHADVILRRNVGLCRSSFPNLPGTATGGLGVEGRQACRRHAQLPPRRSNLLLPG